MRLSRRFLQLDVFADRPGAGNPLAVVIDAADIDTESMQAFAHWTNLSETTFLLPPSVPEASYRVRIFTPQRELAFAGHPSVGTAHAALDSGIAVAREGRLVQECAAGLLPIRVDDEAPARRIFVRAPQARVVPVPVESTVWQAVLGELRLGALPAVVIDIGIRFWLVELADESAVRSMLPELAAIAGLTEATGTVGLAVFAHSPNPDTQLIVRVFCPADGIPEDPVTGSANAAIAAWLEQNNALPARRYTASQGREIGRDGRIQVEVEDSGAVWIGGQTQTVVQGTLEW
jgi:PhzF family phenazine biosynthesis protein